MPRDSAGNYTLPAGNPVITGTTITSDWANNTMTDVGSEITNSLSRNGQGGMLAPLQFVNGNAVQPAMAYVQEPSLGWFRQGVAVMSLGALGDEHLRYDANFNSFAVQHGASPSFNLNPTVAGGTPRFRWRDSAGIRRAEVNFNDADESVNFERYDAAAGLETQIKLTANGNAAVNGAIPIEPADLTRKDYVDTQIQAALDSLVKPPVGALIFGWNPNGLLEGTWTQLPEGTFIMNTVGGSDPAGGSNNAVNIAHGHTLNNPSHNHTASQPPHSHTQLGGRNADGVVVNRAATANPDNPTNFTSEPATPAITVVQATTAVTANDAGVPGTNLNKPLYKGVAVWERTA